MQKSKKALLVLIFFLSSTIVLGQGEANNWFFGANAGISFGGGTPIGLSNGSLVSGEGAASISDAAGNILMYTDGTTIYDRNDNIMPNGNGLNGGNSSSQSAVIIRQPGSNTIYYVFTVAQAASPNGICFSTVNMTLNGGLGNIVLATKNTPLIGPTSEKLSAVKHCNGRDVWVIGHGYNNATFHAWLVTPTGVNTVPINSTVGSDHGTAVIGCLKVSPDGKKIALAVYDVGNTQYIEVFDFNNSTGVLSNPRKFSYADDCYGVEFSPNSELLYYTASASTTTSDIKIYQMDVCQTTQAAMAASAQIIGSSSVGAIRSLQLGPDGKLYFARFGQGWIGVIDDPNIPGVGCGFNVNGVVLSPGTTCKAGLPNFNQSLFLVEQNFNYTQACLTANFSAQTIISDVSCNDPVAQTIWDFGEPSSGAANTSTNATPTHTYANIGSYTVRLILNYSCKRDTLYEVLNINCGVQVTLRDTAICSGTCASIQSTTFGGTPGYTYSWTPNIGTGPGPFSVCPAATTNYIVTATDAAGLIDIDTATVTISVVPTPTFTYNQVNCFGGTDGDVTALASGAGGPFTYSWNTAPITNNAALINVAAGTYQVTVRNAANCTRTANATITQPTQLALTVNKTNTGCSIPTGTATANPSGGTPPYLVTWNTSPVQTGITANAIPAGNFIATVTDANGCIQTQAFTINSSSGPTLNLTTSTNVSCNGGSNGTATVVASVGATPYTYSWSTGQSTATVNNLPAGNHTATVTDNNGCSASVSVVISAPTAIQIQTSISTASCGLANGSATALASGGTLNYTYSWNTTPVQNTATATNVLAGIYTVTATDANGCSATASATVTGITNTTINIATTNVTCFGGNNGVATATISSGTSPFTVTWSNAATGLTVNNLIAGNYSATVIDAAGCSATANFPITQPSAISLATSSIAATCGSSNGSATVTISGGTSPFTAQWNTTPVSNGVVLNNISAGSYIVTVTDNNSCTANANLVVSNSSGPTLNLTASTNASCNGGSNGTATVVASAGAIPYTYSWSTGQTTATVNNLPVGNHTATVTDNNGCSASVSVVITAPSAIQIQTSTTTASCGLANGSVTALASGGTPNYTYSWNTALVQNTATANNIGAGTYTVTATDANGCSVTAAATVTGTTNPTINITATDVTCFGGVDGVATATVGSGTSPFTVTWSNTATGLSVNNLSAGSYSATVTDGVGCAANSSFLINEPNQITAQVTITDAACGSASGAAALILNGGTSPYSISWNSNPIQNGNTLTNVFAGLYTAQITDANGCAQNVAAQVNTLSVPQISVVSSSNISCFGGNNGAIEVSISGGQAPLTLSWNSGQNTTVVSSLNAGNYTATLTDALGCSANLTVSLTEPVDLTSTISTNPTTCGNNNGSATATIIGGISPYTYNWDNNGNTNSTVSNLSLGNHQVIITDANGCSINENFTITALAPPSVSISITNNISCPGGSNGSLSATVNQGELPFIYNWSNGSSGSIISNLTQGNYSVSVTDNNGCIASNSFQLVAPSPWSNSIIPQASTCGSNNGAALLLLNGATSPYTVNWSNGQTLPNAINLLAGNYTVAITDANGCTKTEQTTILDFGGLNVILNQTQPISCFGFNDGAVTATGNGGVAPYSFAWSNGQNSAIATGIQAGNISCTITDVNGCTATAALNILQPDLIAASFSTQHTTCNLSNGSTTINVFGGIAPYSYNWQNGNQSNFITSLAPGQVTCTISDANGCSSVFNENINPSLAITASLNVDQAISCFQGANGVVSVISNSSLTATWSNNTSSLTNANLSAGNYSVIVVDSDACRDTLSITLSEPTQISTTFLNTAAVCSLSNGSSIINISGGTSPYNCNWSNGISGFVNNTLSPGISTAIVTDANGCIFNSTTSILQIFPLQIDSIVVTAANCFGEANGLATATVSGNTGNVTYNWIGTNTSLSSIDSLWAGIYSLSISDGAGCSDIQSFTIAQPDLLQNAIATINARCFGGNSGNATSNVSGGTSPYAYFWNQIQGNDSISLLSAGNYALTIQDANGCSRTDSFSITQPTLLQATINKTNATCGLPNGEMQVIVNGGTAPYNYIWNTGIQTNQINNLLAGIYSVDIFDANNCSVSVVESIVDPGNPIIDTVNIQNIDCFGNATGLVQVSATGGIGNKSFTWNNGVNSSILTNKTAGIYTVIAQDQLGCKDTLTIELTQPALLEASTNTFRAICFGSATGQANVIASGGTAPYSYSWNQNLSQQSFLSQITAGSYIVSVTDANGCNITDTAIVSQPSALQLNVSTSPALCYGQASGTANAVIAGGVPPYNLSWNNGTSGAFLDQLLAGSYYIFAADSNGCSISQGVEIAQPLPLNGFISGDPAACKGNSIQLIVSGQGGTYPYSYLWENGDSNTNAFFTPDSSGFASVVTTDANGCVDSSSKQYRIFELPVLSIISPDTSLCVGQCINLKTADVEGGQFVWNFLNNGSILGQTAQFCSKTVGNYAIYVAVTDINNCFNSLQLPGYIQVNPNPIVDFEPEKRTVPLLDALIKFDNNSIGATTYLWDLDAEIPGYESTLMQPNYQYVEVGSYEITLTGTNEFGCSASSSRFVDILEDFAVYIPNAFTPNGDGLNDSFHPSGIGIDPSDYLMQIYDRWDKLLFETNIWSKGWDGAIENAYRDSLQPGNVFVYKMRVKDFRGEFHKFNGTATLLR